MEAHQHHGRRWIDTTINLQTLIGSILGAAIALGAVYYGLVGRVQALELHDIEHGARFNRVESDMRQQREESASQIRAISGDMKEQMGVISNDVKEIRRYLMDNAAGARPDIRRWSR